VEPAQTTTTILNVDSFELFSIFINSYNVHVCIFISTIVLVFYHLPTRILLLTNSYPTIYQLVPYYLPTRIQQ
jgi:hypothetical protein